MSVPVHLLLCWRWDCPACHKRNHHDGCSGHSIPEDARREAVEAMGGDPDDPEDLADLVTQPEQVVCRNCGDEYPVEDE